MTRLSRMLVLALTLLLGATAQTTVVSSAPVNLGLADSIGQKQPVFFAALDTGFVVVTLPRGPMSGMTADGFFVASGKRKTLFSNEPVLAHALGAGGDFLFLPVPRGPAVAGKLMDVRSGTVKTIEIKPPLLAAAVSKDRVAILTAEAGRPVLAIYRTSDGLIEGRYDLPNNFTFHLMAFSGDDTLLLIERDTLEVMPFSLASDLVPKAKYRFHGAEVDKSLSYAARQRTGGNSRMSLAFAALLQPNGNQMLVLNNIGSERGLRLVEFDAHGQQTAAYHLVPQDDPGTGRKLLVPNLVVTSRGENILALDRSGILREFRLN